MSDKRTIFTNAFGRPAYGLTIFEDDSDQLYVVLDDNPFEEGEVSANTILSRDDVLEVLAALGKWAQPAMVTTLSIANEFGVVHVEVIKLLPWDKSSCQLSDPVQYVGGSLNVNLTQEQATEVREKVREMLANGESQSPG